MDNLCVISNERLVYDHKNKTLQKCVSCTPKRSPEILDQLEAQIIE